MQRLIANPVLHTAPVPGTVLFFWWFLLQFPLPPLSPPPLPPSPPPFPSPPAPVPPHLSLPPPHSYNWHYPVPLHQLRD